MIDVARREIHEAVGESILATQIFESTFVYAAQLVLKHQNAKAMKDLEPLSRTKAAKQPVRAILRELSGALDSKLEARIDRLIERRHRVVHREFADSGLPFDNPVWCASFVELCRGVTAEARVLTFVLATMILKWLERFPEAKKAFEEQDKRRKSRVPRDVLKRFASHFGDQAPHIEAFFTERNMEGKRH